MCVCVLPSIFVCVFCCQPDCVCVCVCHHRESDYWCFFLAGTSTSSGPFMPPSKTSWSSSTGKVLTLASPAVFPRCRSLLTCSLKDHDESHRGDLLQSVEEGRWGLLGEDRDLVHPGLHAECHPPPQIITCVRQSQTGRLLLLPLPPRFLIYSLTVST